MSTNLPAGYHTVTPYLVVDGVDRLLDFLKQVFGAEETLRMPDADGVITHAEVRIGDSVVMMGDRRGEGSAMPAMLYVYVDDCDAIYHRALAAGATSVREPADQPYGDRSAGVRDAHGNEWWMATQLKESV